MYTATIEFFSIYEENTSTVSELGVPSCNRVEKEYYPSLSEDQLELILSSWSDNNDIVDKWLAQNKGNMDFTQENPGNYKINVRIFKK